MTYRTICKSIATAVIGSALLAGTAFAQQASDIDDVKAADLAFHVALSAMDAKAMAGLWANKPYVTNIGPRSKSIEVGYADAVTKWITTTVPNGFSELKATMKSIDAIQTDGKVAWVVGVESATGKTKAGEPFTFDTIVTNIYEKEGNKWLMVSHHAQIPPK